MYTDQIVCPLKETGPGNLRNSEAAVIELDDGRLLLAYTHFYQDAEDTGAGDIRGKLSEDGGKSWSQPFVVRPNTGRCNTGRLSLFRMPGLFDGMQREKELLGLVYVELNRCYDNRLYLSTSIDEGKSWRRDILINTPGMLGNFAQRGDTVVVLRSGRILVPVYAIFGGLSGSFMYYSDDGGITWHRSLGEITIKLTESGRTYGHAHFEEPTVAELKDGRLLCLGRTRMGSLYQSFSADGGLTWSEPVPSGLASSSSPAALKTIPTTSDLVCAWNQTSGQEIADGLGRMRLSCAVSSDDGQSWKCFQNLESLDDMARIEPERGPTDAVSEINAIKARQALKAQSTQAKYPKDVTDRYPRWPGYVHNDYPSVTFTRTGHVVMTYLASDYEMAGLTVGLKLVVRPIDWLYQRAHK